MVIRVCPVSNSGITMHIMFMFPPVPSILQIGHRNIPRLKRAISFILKVCVHVMYLRHTM